MNARGAAEPIVRKVEFAGDTWLFFPTIVPDVAIIRATTADERGNLTFEHEGAYLGPLDQALAVRNNGGIVIAQVKRLAKAGTLKPFAVHVPGRAGRRDRGRARPDADHPDRLRPRHQRRVLPRRGQLPPHALGRRQGDRPPRGAGAARRLGGQSRLRHLGPRAARAARGRPPRRRHLGDRAGCRGRRAAARLPVRLLGQRRGDHALAAAVHLLPGRPASTARCCRSCRSTATAASTSRASPPSRTSPPAAAASSTSPPGPGRSCSAATSPPAPSCTSRTATCTSRARARSRSWCPRSSTSRSAAGAAIEQGQDVTYVTERCVMRLLPARHHRHRDRARRRPRSATCWPRPRSSSRSRPTCAPWTPALFRPEPIGLRLEGADHV